MKILKVALILILALSLRILVLNLLNLGSFYSTNLLIFELLDAKLNLNLIVFIFFGLLNVLLLYRLGNKLNPRIGLVLSFLYAISPWTIYVEQGRSIYILVILAILISIWGLTLIFESRYLIGNLAFVLGFCVLLSTSILTLPLTLFLVFILSKKYPNKKIKNIILSEVGFIFLIFIVVLAIRYQALMFILKDQVTLFNDVGLLNSVNQLQGESSNSGYKFIAKFTENKFEFGFLHFVFNFLTNLSPATYFSPQAKLLGFSFTPPIVVILLVPFVFGISQVYKKINLIYLFLFTFFLILPSVVSKNSPDLNRLVITAPGIFLIIAFGYIRVIRHLDNKKRYFWMTVLILMGTIQYLVIYSDLLLREIARMGG